ncbi:MAG: hypothetical protein Q8O01_01005 [Candidatus Omnitrophota bacterium]|nr:hypothetical protein [Candidatus Omnitrophota bacterium]
MAICFLASVIAYSISAFIVARYASKLSRERVVVSNLLREDMENFLSVNYADIVDGSVTTDIIINDGLRAFSVTKTLRPETVVEGIYGYKKIYGKIVWSGGILGNKPLMEEGIIYVTKK